MSQMPFEPQKKWKSQSVLPSTAMGWVGLLIVLPLGRYAGLAAMIPAVATAALWMLGRKVLAQPKQVIVSALAVNGGHFLWLLVALVVAGFSNLDALGADLVVLMVGLVWLVVRPGMGSVCFLAVYQLLSLGVNGHGLVSASLGSPEQRAMLVSVFWRAWALYCLAKLFLDLRAKPEAD